MTALGFLVTCRPIPHGTRMPASGARQEELQWIMGHADLSMTTSVYTNQDEALLREAILILKILKPRKLF